jgi:hypothetical protein
MANPKPDPPPTDPPPNAPANPPRQTMGHLPKLRRGKDHETVLSNSLALMQAGWPKDKAMALALTLAGFRPASATSGTPADPTTPSSTIH